jgi:hypothetical protein
MLSVVQCWLVPLLLFLDADGTDGNRFLFQLVKETAGGGPTNEKKDF